MELIRVKAKIEDLSIHKGNGELTPVGEQMLKELEYLVKLANNTEIIGNVSVSSPLDELHKWCENEGWKEGVELLVRSENMKPIIVDCNSKTSVSEFKNHIDER
jgi:hypothetical protein